MCILRSCLHIYDIARERWLIFICVSQLPERSILNDAINYRRKSVAAMSSVNWNVNKCWTREKSRSRWFFTILRCSRIIFERKKWKFLFIFTSKSGAWMVRERGMSWVMLSTWNHFTDTQKVAIFALHDLVTLTTSSIMEIYVIPVTINTQTEWHLLPPRNSYSRRRKEKLILDSISDNKKRIRECLTSPFERRGRRDEAEAQDGQLSWMGRSCEKLIYVYLFKFTFSAFGELAFLLLLKRSTVARKIKSKTSFGVCDVRCSALKKRI